MGAGQGKNRRASGLQPQLRTKNSVMVPAGTAEFDTEKWNEFVEGGELAKVKLYDYYLGERADENYTNAEHGQVLTELLLDAETVGALSLPSPYKAEDFQLVVEDDADGNVRLKRVQLSLKGKPEKGQAGFAYGMGYDISTRLHNVASAICSLLKT